MCKTRKETCDPAAAADGGAPPFAPPQRLVSSWHDDPALCDILPDFIANLPQQVRELQQLAQAGEIDSLADAVHQLKGAGGCYGFQAITDAARMAEESARGGAPLEQIRAQVASLVTVIRSVDGYEPFAEVQHAA